MKNGQTVAAFESAFAEYVGARYAIALCNGTATLHAALVALGVQPGDRVAVPPLTMASTTIAVLHAGAVPVFVDVDPDTWLMKGGAPDDRVLLGVSLYGLHWHGTNYDYRDGRRANGLRGIVDDAAQTLAPFEYGRNEGWPDFKSYSFQASKLLALGEGGMLVTNDEALATRAREFSSLGYRMAADQPRIDPAALKSPTFDRHHSLGWNYRMSDLVAAEGLRWMAYNGERGDAARFVDIAPHIRQQSAAGYRDAIDGCDWLTPQHIPDGWEHDMWSFAVACDTPQRALDLSAAIVKHGGEAPYPAWRITYQEIAFRHLAPDGTCPVAESLQPRLLAFQTNDLASADRNATALRQAIREMT